MAMTSNEYTIKGKLQVVFDGHEPMELGDVEIPVRLDFRKAPRPGYRGDIHVTNVAGQEHDPYEAGNRRVYEAGRKLQSALIGDG